MLKICRGTYPFPGLPRVWRFSWI